MNIKVINDRVVVEKDKDKELTSGGIYIPPSVQKEQSRGIVVAVGSGKIIGIEKFPLEIKVGDHVVFDRYAGIDVEIGEGEGKKKYWVIRENDIVCVLDKGCCGGNGENCCKEE